MLSDECVCGDEKDLAGFTPKCEMSSTLEIFNEFNEIYKERLRELGDGRHVTVLKLKTLEDWVSDLTEQNKVLVETVEALEKDALYRLEAGMNIPQTGSHHDLQETQGKLQQSEKEIEKLKNMLTENDAKLDKIKEDITASEKSAKEMRAALTAEVAEKHDQVLALRREVQHLEDKLRQADMQTHFKDDIIKELRKEIKVFNSKFGYQLKDKAKAMTVMEEALKDGKPEMDKCNRCSGLVKVIVPQICMLKKRVDQAMYDLRTKQSPTQLNCCVGELLSDVIESLELLNDCLTLQEKQRPNSNVLSAKTESHELCQNLDDSIDSDVQEMFKRREINEQNKSIQMLKDNFKCVEEIFLLGFNNLIVSDVQCKNKKLSSWKENLLDHFKKATTLLKEIECNNVKQDLGEPMIDKDTVSDTDSWKEDSPCRPCELDWNETNFLESSTDTSKIFVNDESVVTTVFPELGKLDEDVNEQAQNEITTLKEVQEVLCCIKSRLKAIADESETVDNDKLTACQRKVKFDFQHKTRLLSINEMISKVISGINRHTCITPENSLIEHQDAMMKVNQDLRELNSQLQTRDRMITTQQETIGVLQNSIHLQQDEMNALQSKITDMVLERQRSDASYVGVVGDLESKVRNLEGKLQETNDTAISEASSSSNMTNYKVDSTRSSASKGWSPWSTKQAPVRRHIHDV